MYTVSAASRMSGVHPETLRAWERRYELVCPRRDERGRRMYADHDIARLRLARLATELGHPISRLAAMSTEELSTVVGQSADHVDGRAELEPLVVRVMDAVNRYRCDECEEVLGLAATMLSVERLVHELLVPVLNAVGERRAKGALTVAQERLISACVGRTAHALIARLRLRQAGPAVLLATPPGERHELGLLMSALLLSQEGVDCIYLGPDVPLVDLADAAGATSARCVCLDLETSPQPDGMHAALQDMAGSLPCHCQVWLAGPGAVTLDARRLPACCVLLSNDEDLPRLARALG